MSRKKADPESEKVAADKTRQRQLEALERIMSGPEWDVSVNGRMPTSDERNARPWHKRWGLPYE